MASGHRLELRYARLPFIDVSSYLRRRWKSLARLPRVDPVSVEPLSATLPESLAGVAQTAEHLHGKEGVRGSIPLSGSTQSRSPAALFTFRIDSVDRAFKGSRQQRGNMIEEGEHRSYVMSGTLHLIPFFLLAYNH